jgi:formylmethanofuran dehydrogenase subunit B
VHVVLQGGRITQVTPECARATAWFGTGDVPTASRARGREAPLDATLTEAVSLLTDARGRVLVLLAPGLPTASYGAAIGLADRLGAVVETPHGDTGLEFLLAAQRRGRTTATLGEPRHRADVWVYWGCDPAEGWPRFAERYGEASRGLHRPDGRADRRVLSVHVGTDRGPADADAAIAITPADEVAAIGAMRAALRGGTASGDGRLAAAADFAVRLAESEYIALVYDPEHGDPARSTARAEALFALAQQLNGPTSRCALVALRGGGNAAGIESVLTWQTGFPAAVDFATGVPTYRPALRGSLQAMAGACTAALVAGDLSAVRAPLREAVLRLPHVVIGPSASVHAPDAVAAVDTGTAGIHEAGTAYRMDDVPLPLTALLPHPHQSAAVLGQLETLVTARLRGAA